MSNKNVSRFLSLVLRHKPETIGIKLDKNGWVSVSELIGALLLNNRDINLEELETIVATNNKSRFEFNSDRTMIRASQGHSINVDLQLKAVRPPMNLYHGTTEDNMLQIRKSGVAKMNRHHVHLSDNKETAKAVGNRRKSNTVIIIINAWAMYTEGHKFYKSSNGVWLTDQVPIKYFVGEE